MTKKGRNALSALNSGTRGGIEIVVPGAANPWETGELYDWGDLVRMDGLVYRCVREHFSGMFEDDLDSGLWVHEPR